MRDRAMTRSELRIYKRLWMRRARGRGGDTGPAHQGKKIVNGKLVPVGFRLPGGPRDPRRRAVWRELRRKKFRPYGGGAKPTARGGVRCFGCGTKERLRTVEREVIRSNGRQVPATVLWCGKC